METLLSSSEGVLNKLIRNKWKSDQETLQDVDCKDVGAFTKRLGIAAK